MNNDLCFKGLWNATAEQRYKHFITYVADYESVWLLSNKDGVATIDVDDYINFLVFPSKEFATAYAEVVQKETDSPMEVDVHDFCKHCEAIINEKSTRFMVFPTDKDVWVISTEELLKDLIEGLEQVE